MINLGSNLCGSCSTSLQLGESAKFPCQHSFCNQCFWQLVFVERREACPTCFCFAVKVLKASENAEMQKAQDTYSSYSSQSECINGGWTTEPVTESCSDSASSAMDDDKKSPPLPGLTLEQEEHGLAQEKASSYQASTSTNIHAGSSQPVQKALAASSWIS